MALMIRYIKGRACPLVFCDHCGERIKDATDANYMWLDEGGLVAYTHKACCHAFEEASGRSWGADELACLPIYLGNGLKLDWGKARELASLMASIGD